MVSNILKEDMLPVNHTYLSLLFTRFPRTSFSTSMLSETALLSYLNVDFKSYSNWF